MAEAIQNSILSEKKISLQKNLSMNKEEISQILDILYSTIKGISSNKTQKLIALDTLSQFLLDLKHSSFINQFLNCYLWIFITNQYYNFKIQNISMKNLFYTEVYYQKLEDTLKKCSQILGQDNEGRITPFRKYWTQINQRGSLETANRLTLMVSLVQFQDGKTIQNLVSFLKTEHLDEADKKICDKFSLKIKGLTKNLEREDQL